MRGRVAAAHFPGPRLAVEVVGGAEWVGRARPRPRRLHRGRGRDRPHPGRKRLEGHRDRSGCVGPARRHSAPASTPGATRCSASWTRSEDTGMRTVAGGHRLDAARLASAVERAAEPGRCGRRRACRSGFMQRGSAAAAPGSPSASTGCGSLPGGLRFPPRGARPWAGRPTPGGRGAAGHGAADRGPATAANRAGFHLALADGSVLEEVVRRWQLRRPCRSRVGPGLPLVGPHERDSSPAWRACRASSW